jgi:signal transduction histidine kinase
VLVVAAEGPWRQGLLAALAGRARVQPAAGVTEALAALAAGAPAADAVLCAEGGAGGWARLAAALPGAGWVWAGAGVGAGVGAGGVPGGPGARRVEAGAPVPLLAELLLSVAAEAAARRALRALEARLLQAEPLATVGLLAAGIAHELLNPVTYVSQNVHLLEGSLEQLGAALTGATAGAPPGPGTAQVLEDARALLADVGLGARQVREVAVGLRALARPEGAEQACELAEVAGFALKAVRAQRRPRAQLSLAADLPALRVRGSRLALLRGLLPLLHNGVDAVEGTGRPGRVEVRWAEAPGGAVRLEVADNGRGVAEAVLPHALEPTVTDRPGAAGMGLALAREALAQAGGEVRLRQGGLGPAGEGATAEVLLLRA